MIIKIAASDEATRKMMNMGIIFNNEIVIYSKVLPKFVSLQNAANVPKEDRLRIAECYGYLQEEPHEILLLEDLKVHGFGLMNRFQPLPKDYVKIILKEFAIFHSLSYALKSKEPTTYTTYEDKLIDVWTVMNDNPDSEKMFDGFGASVMSMFDNKEYRDLIKKAFSFYKRTYEKLKKYDSKSKHSVIHHGDAWTNNILFRTENSNPVECILIDYQISKNANPACDILYMIFSCTDGASRAEHFYEWLDYYHRELDKSLSYYGLKSNLVYPQDQLDADVRQYAKIYFVASLFVLNFLVRKTSEAADFKKQSEYEPDVNKIVESMSVSALSIETASLYKIRIEELICSCKEFGLL
ncbi:hypothetical protein ACJJTC_014439 [Scirpophaga incertulas]